MDRRLPTDHESAAALEFIGFEKATAEELYQRWETRPEQYPYSFLEHAAGHFENRDQGDQSHADFMTVSQSETWPGKKKPFWRGSMTDEIKLQEVGLKVEFQAAILDLQFAGIFETETLKFWIKDTLASRYYTIAYLQRRSTEGLESAPAVRIGAPAAALGDHYVLYQGRVAHTDKDTPLIAPDGAVDLTSIDTPAGGDFNARERASYWTPEAATAELYRGYAERRDAYAETWIVSIQVPKAFVATLRNVSLWYSADWKEYV